MNGIDYLALDGHDLRLFLAVLEEGSVTEAALRLGLTQSAVSHGLTKLRAALGDPLFVKAGRGIVATEHARALAEPAQALLDNLKTFTRPPQFDSASAKLSLTVAANDFQRDLLLPAVFAELERSAASVRLRVIHSGVPSAEMLRENECDLLISPHPPPGTDILQKRLLEDRYVCFYDAATRQPPQDKAAYLAARHITVVYTEHDRLDFDKRLEAMGIRRDFAIAIPSFSGVPAFLRGSRLLASMPRLLNASFMRGFAIAPLPDLTGEGRAHEVLPMYLAWHRRNQHDPAHAWVRGLIARIAAGTIGQTGPETAVPD